MKFFLLLVAFLGTYNNSFSQEKTVEIKALELALASHDSSLYITDSIIFLNKKANIAPSLSYFLNRQWWHIHGILKEKCYDKYDSIKNAGIAPKKITLASKNSKIRVVNNDVWKKTRKIKMFIYKRFYYCSQIYVLLLHKDLHTGINTEILITFDSNEKFISLNATSFVY